MALSTWFCRNLILMGCMQHNIEGQKQMLHSCDETEVDWSCRRRSTVNVWCGQASQEAEAAQRQGNFATLSLQLQVSLQASCLEVFVPSMVSCAAVGRQLSFA